MHTHNRYKGCVQGKSYRHVCGLLASGFQMMGTLLYFGPEWQMGFIHLPTHVSTFTDLHD